MAKGDYTSATITVDGEGRVVTAESGSVGGGASAIKIATNGPASGTWTANPAANIAYAFIGAGGGGGGGTGAGAQAASGTGGYGGYGYYTGPVSGGTGYAYNVGAAGARGQGWPGPNAGSAGGSSTLTNVGTANAGNGGNYIRPGHQTASPGNPGSAPGASFDSSNPSSTIFYSSPASIFPGAGTNAAGQGQAGGTGYMVVYDNSGT